MTMNYKIYLLLTIITVTLRFSEQHGVKNGGFSASFSSSSSSSHSSSSSSSSSATITGDISNFNEISGALKNLPVLGANGAAGSLSTAGSTTGCGSKGSCDNAHLGSRGTTSSLSTSGGSTTGCGSKGSCDNAHLSSRGTIPLSISGSSAGNQAGTFVENDDRIIFPTDVLFASTTNIPSTIENSRFSTSIKGLLEGPRGPPLFFNIAFSPSSVNEIKGGNLGKHLHGSQSSTQTQTKNSDHIQSLQQGSGGSSLIFNNPASHNLHDNSYNLLPPINVPLDQYSNRSVSSEGSQSSANSGSYGGVSKLSPPPYLAPTSSGSSTIAGTTDKTSCCKGPFPGPSGSIHASKPASSVPPIQGGSYSVSAGSTGDGSSSYGSKPVLPGSPGNTDTSKPAISTGNYGPSIGGSGSGYQGSLTPEVNGQATSGSKSGCCKGPFPGPNGSIHDSKPASSVPHNDNNGQYNSGSWNTNTHKGSGGSGNGYVTGSAVIHKPSSIIGGVGNGYTTGSNSAHSGQLSSGCGSGNVNGCSVKPSTNNPLGSNTAFGTGSGNGFATGSVIIGTPSSGSSTIGGSGNGYASIGNSNILSSCANGNTDGCSSGTIPSQKPTSIASGSGTVFGTGKDNGYATGSVIIHKPTGNFPVSDGNDGKSSPSDSGNLPSGCTGGSGCSIKPISNNTPVESGNTFGTGSGSGSISTSHSGQYNQGGSGYATGSVVVQKPFTNGCGGGNGCGNSPSSFPAGNSYNTGSVETQKPSVIPTGTDYGSGSSVDSSSGSGTGFSTGSVEIQKPSNIPSGSSYSFGGGSSSGSTHSSGLENENGYATGSVQIQKPSNLPSGSGYGIGTGLSGGSGSGIGFGGGSGSGNGYATGSVQIHKPSNLPSGSGFGTGTEFGDGRDYGNGFGGGSSSGSTHSSGSGSTSSHTIGSVQIQKPSNLPSGNAYSAGTVFGGASSSGSGYATGSVHIQKPSTLPSGNGYGSGGGFGSGSGSGVGYGGGSSSGSGYATGSVHIQKPSTVPSGNGYGSGSGGGFGSGSGSGVGYGSGSSSGSGHAIGSVDTQKSINPSSGSSSGSGSGLGFDDGSGSGSGYATGSVEIDKSTNVPSVSSGTSNVASVPITGTGALPLGPGPKNGYDGAYVKEDKTPNDSDKATYTSSGGDSHSSAGAGSYADKNGPGCCSGSSIVGSGSGGASNGNYHSSGSYSGANAGSYSSSGAGSGTYGSSHGVKGGIGGGNGFGFSSGYSGSFSTSNAGAGIPGLGKIHGLVDSILQKTVGGSLGLAGSLSKTGSFSKAGSVASSSSFASASAGSAAFSSHY